MTRVLSASEKRVTACFLSEPGGGGLGGKFIFKKGSFFVILKKENNNNKLKFLMWALNFVVLSGNRSISHNRAMDTCQTDIDHVLSWVPLLKSYSLLFGEELIR